MEELGTELFSRSSSTETIISRASTDGERLGQKPNRLKNKAARYESHKQFLEKCIQDKLIPEGLRLQMEPTIGNYDYEFLHNWHVKLEKFSLELMTDVADFCNKTLANTRKVLKKLKWNLKLKLKLRNLRVLEKQSPSTGKKLQKLSRYERNANTVTLSTDDPDRTRTQRQETLKAEEAGAGAEAEAEAPHAEIIFSKNKEVTLRY